MQPFDEDAFLANRPHRNSPPRTDRKVIGFKWLATGWLPVERYVTRCIHPIRRLSRHMTALTVGTITGGGEVVLRHRTRTSPSRRPKACCRDARCANRERRQTILSILSDDSLCLSSLNPSLPHEPPSQGLHHPGNARPFATPRWHQERQERHAAPSSRTR